MALNLGLAGHRWDAGEHTWTSSDAILYALGVGAGAGDALAELAFTTENSHSTPQQVLPTFAVMLSSKQGGPHLGDFKLAQLLHAEQSIAVHSPLPASGTARTTSQIVGFQDKGRDALVVMESTSVEVTTGRLLVQSTSTIFVRGEGGFGGDRGISEAWSVPGRAADHIVTYRTRPDQALLYRLSGDRNPLHSDPWFANRAGFDRPILHGLCTYGFTGRALLHTLCHSDPAMFGSMSVRFAAPVWPGQELSVHIWDEGEQNLFQTKVGDTVVLDRGVFSMRKA